MPSNLGKRANAQSQESSPGLAQEPSQGRNPNPVLAKGMGLSALHPHPLGEGSADLNYKLDYMVSRSRGKPAALR